jgi:pSer/pThr/pTyr-binding forkhead associated (FHA) protein
MVRHTMTLSEYPVDDSAFLEIRTRGVTAALPLAGDRVTIGKDASNDVALSDDATVSRLHAVLERYAAGWSVRDLGSRNGTIVNGTRIWQDRPLHDRDEVRIGAARLIYRCDRRRPAEPTMEDVVDTPPELTRREREVLIELCLPALQRQVFTLPADNGAIAAALRVSKAAVKPHLASLFAKFGISSEDGDAAPNRIRLANEALRRGAVTMALLRETDRERKGRRHG